MSKEEVDNATKAAMAVMAALQPLSAEEKLRVLQSAAALFGVQAFPVLPNITPAPQNSVNAGAPSAVSSTGNVSAPPSKRVSLVELIKEKSPATNYQRIACFAYYREKYEGKPNFSSIDLAGYFSQAKLPAPGPNYARDYNSAVKQAWIHDDEAKSYLTQEGEAAVEAGFDGKRTSSKSMGKRKSGKSE